MELNNKEACIILDLNIEDCYNSKEIKKKWKTKIKSLINLEPEERNIKEILINKAYELIKEENDSIESRQKGKRPDIEPYIVDGIDSIESTDFFEKEINRKNNNLQTIDFNDIQDIPRENREVIDSEIPTLMEGDIDSESGLKEFNRLFEYNYCIDDSEDYNLAEKITTNAPKHMPITSKTGNIDFNFKETKPLDFTSTFVYKSD